VRWAATFAAGASRLIAARPPTWSGWVCVMKIVPMSVGFIRTLFRYSRILGAASGVPVSTRMSRWSTRKKVFANVSIMWKPLRSSAIGIRPCRAITAPPKDFPPPHVGRPDLARYGVGSARVEDGPHGPAVTSHFVESWHHLQDGSES